MAKILLDGTTDYYDDELDVVIDKYGNICSSTPAGTFAFGDKLYTYGTVVTMHSNGRNYKAVFEKGSSDDEFKTADSKSTTSIYGSCGGWYNWSESTYVIEIKKAVPYIPTLPIRETPPTAVGYKTVSYKDPKDPSKTTYQDHLYGCHVDGAGNIIHSVLGNNFGFKKHVYAPGTRVVVRSNAGDKTYNAKKLPEKVAGEKQYIYYTAQWDGMYYKFDGTLIPRDTDVRKSSWHGQPERIGKLGGMTIVYISEPHYFRPEAKKTTAWERFKLNGGNAPADTSVGTVWYIVIMLVATIFKARIGIWILATIVFLLWKYGYMNKK